MKRVARGAALFAAAALMVGAKPLPPSVEGWSAVPGAKSCALAKGPIILATPDGETFLLGVRQANQPKTATVRRMMLGGRSYTLVFEPGKVAATAVVPISGAEALAQSGVVEADWIEGGRHDLGDVGPAIIALVHCGDARAEKARRQQDFANRLMAAGAAMRDRPISIPSLDTPTHVGMTCFKEREWTSGMNKNCVYDCLGSEAVQTVGAVDLCPLTIQR